MNRDEKQKSDREPQPVHRKTTSWGRRGDLIKLRLENLPDTTTLLDLRDLFSQFGEVYVVNLHWASNSTWGLVELFERGDAEEFPLFEPIVLHGQRLRVQEY